MLKCYMRDFFLAHVCFEFIVDYARYARQSISIFLTSVQDPRFYRFWVLPEQFAPRAFCRKQFAEETLWRLCTEMCSALSYLHNKGIVHRDLKPLNVFLTAGNHVKVSLIRRVVLCIKHSERFSISILDVRLVLGRLFDSHTLKFELSFLSRCEDVAESLICCQHLFAKCYHSRY